MMRYVVPRLETERLIMRAHVESDIESEIEFYQTDASETVGGPMEPTDVWRYISMMMGHWALRGYGFWALEEKATGIYLGRAGPWMPMGYDEPEIGWTLMNHATGKGYATEAALAARSYAYDVLGWETAVSLTLPDNIASQAVAKRLGATLERTFESKYGTAQVWRHPRPDDLENGGMEAYA
ncbi:GNAT family N-acetyltransferase [Shimia sp. NS0008-38b]|uniref:GNAT family N-acetyltransferase n=1 Tax=Shimia sp. NS0008-38b TaxID=3127653 RepID=UPI00310AF7CC